MMVELLPCSGREPILKSHAKRLFSGSPQVASIEKQHLCLQLGPNEIIDFKYYYMMNWAFSCAVSPLAAYSTCHLQFAKALGLKAEPKNTNCQFSNELD
jgi:hypothetical protein